MIAGQTPTSRDWERTFAHWAGPPSRSEQNRCDNALSIVRNAIARSERLRSRGVRSFAQGSYHNRVNIGQESDVDVGVLCYDTFFPDYPKGRAAADFGNIDSPYTYSQFKDELEEALVAHVGRRSVRRGKKALHVTETSYHVEADVVPFFEYREYFQDGTYRCGVALLPDDGSRRIENYPERLLDSWPPTPLHYENGVRKNTSTARTYKGIVRILKNLRAEMESEGMNAARQVPGFLIECLVWNVPDARFAHPTWTGSVQAVLAYLEAALSGSGSSEWTEVNAIKYLFHSTQAWTQAACLAFVRGARRYVEAS